MSVVGGSPYINGREFPWLSDSMAASVQVILNLTKFPDLFETYIWRVRCECETSDTLISSSFSAVDTFSLCSLLAPRIGSSIGDSELEVFPNPADRRMTVISAGGADAELELIDAFGRVVQHVELPASGMIEMDVSHLSPGVYFAVVWTAKGRKIRRLMIE